MKYSWNGKSSLRKAAFIVPMLVCILLHLSPAAGQSPAFDDTRENGPFNQRYFARIKGAPVSTTPAPQTPQVKPAVDFITNADGATNELVVLLQYDQAASLRGLLGTAGKSSEAATAPGLERAVLSALQNQSSKELSSLFRSPAYSRFLLDVERMTDADRERGAKARSPREKLERFMVLRYATVAAAQTAAAALVKEPSIASAAFNTTVVQSFAPNDPYFSPVGDAANYPKPYYQWGLHAMNFPAAWDRAKGQAQVGVLDTGFFGEIVYNSETAWTVDTHPDLILNSRPHFTPGAPITTSGPGLAYHPTHVAGIIAAQSNNLNSGAPLPNGRVFSGGTSGGCINCSITAFPFLQTQYILNTDVGTASKIIKAITKAVDGGMQIINWSGSLPELPAGQQTGMGHACPNVNDAFCEVLRYMTEREVIMPVSAGNFNQTSQQLLPPLKYSSSYTVLPVGGTEIANPQIGVPGSRWYYGWLDDRYNGSAEASLDGVMGPAKSIVSTMVAGKNHARQPYAMCGDSVDLFEPYSVLDESSGRFANGLGDGVGSCTGTSMAAPHISALAGLIRSINPRLSALATRSIIQNSGNLASNRTATMGYGMPNALTAVNATIGTNPNKLTPLFSFYSTARLDSFYTTVPQMGIAALMGSLMPRKSMGLGAYAGADGVYESAYGNNLNMYYWFPTFDDFVIGGSGDTSPRSQVWLFTTHVNPKSQEVPLLPIYRMSWKCGDPTLYPAEICNTPDQKHIDTVLLMESEVAYFKSLGYKIDALEGYTYPKNLPQPAGTVRLIRKYHPGRDDHAIFPETAWPTMQAQGYTANTNTTDWLGYVYPNTNGSMPTIQ